MTTEGANELIDMMKRCRAEFAALETAEKWAYVKGVDDALQTTVAALTVSQRGMALKSELHVSMAKHLRDMHMATLDMVRELIPDEYKT
jgi:hypothetical protein